MKQSTINIGGMSCAACASRIEKMMFKLDGVDKASVNLATEKLFVEFDEQKVTIDDIKNAVTKIGFKVIEKDSKTIAIPIDGMTCAACSSRVEKVLGKMDGIENVTVNLATEKASITYDTSIIRISNIKQKITEIGYTPLTANSSSSSDEEKIRKEKEIKTMWTKFTIATIFTVPLFYIAMAPMIPFIDLPFPQFLEPMENPMTYALVELFLVIPTMLAGYKFYAVGFKALIQRSPNMDSLVAIGTSAAFIYSTWNTYLISQGIHHAVDHLYFETAGVIITLILLGKSLEIVSKGKTSEAIKELMSLAPKVAIVIQNDEEVEIPIDEVEIGDIIVVKPGTKIPVDGIVTLGYSAIDESMLTGESMPIDKNIGDKVYAASLNTTGMIQVKATKVGSDTALSQIIQLVEQAQGSKAPIAKLADIISGHFVPIACVIAIIAGTIWYAYAKDIEFALTIFISVLVIACPCALGLATPTAIMVSTGKGAENGILIKSGETLEIAHTIDTIILDKTGTITEGKPTVTDIVVVDEYESNELLQLCASVEKPSEHPLAQAIVKYAQDKKIDLVNTDNFNSITGQGIKAQIGKKSLLVGNEKLMNENNVSLAQLENTSDRLANEGKTPMYIAIDNKLAGIIAVADIIKQTSVEAIKTLQNMNIEVIMITGDNEKTAMAIAKQVGISKVLAEVLPNDKANEITKLQKQGKKVAMVGDGINDAIALAQANIGIAIGSGTDVAIESADVVLMRSDLLDVCTTIKLSRKTIRIIKQNLFWAFSYNTIGIPVAAGLLYAFGGPLLNPMIGAAAMSMSSISVLTNALRLKRFTNK